MNPIRKVCGLMGQIVCVQGVLQDTLKGTRTIGKDSQLWGDMKGPEICQLQASLRLLFEGRDSEGEN